MKKKLYKLKEKKYIISKDNKRGDNKTNIRKRILVFLIIAAILSIGYLFKDNLYNIFDVSFRQKYNKILSNREIAELEKKLEIQESGIELPNTIKLNNKPKYLVIHHTASENMTVERIDEIHKGNGWDSIGYHYYIRKDGKIYSGRKENMEGAHAVGENKRSIGICLEGNFENEVITEKQKEAIDELSLYLCLKYDITDIIGHKEVYNTLCPGSNINIQKLKEEIIEMIKEI